MSRSMSRCFHALLVVTFLCISTVPYDVHSAPIDVNGTSSVERPLNAFHLTHPLDKGYASGRVSAVGSDSLQSRGYRGARLAMRPQPGSGNYVSDPKPRPPLHPDGSTFAGSVDAPNARFVVYNDLYANTDKYGTPDPGKLAGFTHFNIAFWTAKDGPQDNAAQWARATDEERRRRKKQYNDAGIKLMVSAFGATDRPQSGPGLGNATKTANRLANFVLSHQLDGVDVDYEEIDTFANGRAVPWLIALTKQLRRRLPKDKYLISHAPVAPWFAASVYKDGGYVAVNREVGDDIDFYNVQFYNQGKDAYVDCDDLIWAGPQQWPSTSVFEIAKYGKVDLNKIVIGKPAIPGDADSGYMSKRDLGKCAQSALANGWSAGLMWWQFPNINSHTLGRVRSYGF